VSNRAERRRSVRDFRHEAHRDHIVTHLLDVRCDLSAHPMLNSVAKAWTAAIERRKPYCFCCRANYATSDAQPGAFLFAVPRNATDIASVSTLCRTCWTDLPKATIERTAASVLRHLAPGGRFIDP
jgi:hypothetical protein